MDNESLNSLATPDYGSTARQTVGGWSARKVKAALNSCQLFFVKIHLSAAIRQIAADFRSEKMTVSTWGTSGIDSASSSHN
jgi:hypothetical protein